MEKKYLDFKFRQFKKRLITNAVQLCDLETGTYFINYCEVHILRRPNRQVVINYEDDSLSQIHNELDWLATTHKEKDVYVIVNEVFKDIYKEIK